jgi:hypothetical protein
MKTWSIILSLVLLAGVVAGCGGQTSVSAAGATSADLAASGDGGAYTSAVLGTAYEGALPASSQLVLGTFDLEGTANAVTPEQARTLLPLWRAIQSGTLQSDAETSAVLKQIEGAMTAEQLAAIAAMQLTAQDLGAWMQEQGVNFAPPSDATPGSGSLPSGGPSEEERAAMQATVQAGGEMPGGGGSFGALGNMSEEERAAMRATAEASGMTFGNRGAAGAGSGQLSMMAGQVVNLLVARAGG